MCKRVRVKQRHLGWEVMDDAYALSATEVVWLVSDLQQHRVLLPRSFQTLCLLCQGWVGSHGKFTASGNGIGHVNAEFMWYKPR